MKNLILEQLKRATKNNPITRGELVDVLHVSDRSIRDSINELRCEGIRICSTPSGKGYWLAESEADYQAFRNIYTSSAKSIFKAVDAMDRNLYGQIEMDIKKDGDARC